MPPGWRYQVDFILPPVYRAIRSTPGNYQFVYLPDGRLLNAEIIAQGYGHAYTRFRFAKMEEFRALEREAREKGRGLWRGDASGSLRR